MRANSIVRLAVVASILVHGATLGGDLNPPPGPIAPTGRSIAQVEPRIPVSDANTPGNASWRYIITQPGSYYLTGNIDVTVFDQSGIWVQASDVTLDLMGFTIAGPAFTTRTGILVSKPGSATNVTIRNGSVVNWGVDVWASDSPTHGTHGCAVIDVCVRGSQGTGIRGGPHTRITDCTVQSCQAGINTGAWSLLTNCNSRSNAVTGIVTSASSTLTDCIASNNTGIGISVTNGCTIIGCIAASNESTGISATSGNSIINCNASFNGASGINAGSGNTISACTARLNTADGFTVLENNRLTDCTSESNLNRGFFTGNGCTITGCVAAGNTSLGINAMSSAVIRGSVARSNGSNGIQAASGSTISDCSAYQNSANGISVGQGNTVSNCTAVQNTGDGIIAFSNCLILNNNCQANGAGAGSGAGIHVTAADNRIEGNNCMGADRGIDVDVAGNIIVRNTCSGNTTNWDIVANNVFGPILNRTAPASAAVLGDSAASSLGSTDANANYTY